MEPKKVLITGGAGFIGSQLGFALSTIPEKFSVVLLDNLSFGHLDNLVVEGSTFGRFCCRDIRDRELANDFEGVDTVFHFAGISSLPVCQAKPHEAFDINVGGVANVLEAARLKGVRRVIFASTSAVYERSVCEEVFSEDQLLTHPDLTYAQTKFFAEQVCQSYAKNYGMDIIICRFFNVYGPHQDFKRTSPPFTSYLAREFAAGRSPKLFNASPALRDYIHVADVISLLIKMSLSDCTFRADAFNVCTGVGYSVPELVSLMKSEAKVEQSPEFQSASAYWDAYPTLFSGLFPLSKQRVCDEVYKHCVGSNDKARRTFDWEPAILINEGLKSVFVYAMAHQPKR